MATTTPNFGWPVPTSTDLVKDGATAIEALGDAIDASMLDFKGGTTGQVLSKTSATDMDFTWVAQDDSNAIQNTQLTAKGALITAFSSATPATLTVGNNGESLVADSSTSTGLRYNAQNALVNPVINGGMDIWQRGTSFAVSTSVKVYTADRWSFWRGGLVAGATVSRQNTSDTTNLPNIQYCSRVQRDSGNTSTQPLNFASDFESVNSTPYAGKTVTVSFYARKGANYSVAASDLNMSLISGTGTNQDIINGYTGQVTVGSGFQVITSTWQRFVVSGTVPTTSNQLGVIASSGAPVGTAGANDYFEITGVQIDLGTYTASSAPTFRRTGGTIQGELSAAQRYYWRTTSNGTTATAIGQIATASSTTTVSCPLRCPVTMRVTPTSVDFSNLAVLDIGASRINVTAVALDNPSPDIASVSLTSSGLTTQRNYVLYNQSAATGYIGFSAEL
jgi:hypothetical protein